MRIKEGDEVLDKEGAVFKIRKIERDMVILESKNENRQIMTGISSLENAYKKKEKKDD
jgi:hypothetical protein